MIHNGQNDGIDFEDLYVSNISPKLIKEKWVIPDNDDDGNDAKDFDSLYILIQLGAGIKDKRIDSTELNENIKYLIENLKEDRCYINACKEILKNNIDFIKEKIKNIIKGDEKKALSDLFNISVQDKGEHGERSGLVKVSKIIRPKEGMPFKSTRWVRSSKELLEHRPDEMSVDTKVKNIIDKMSNISIDKISERDPMKAEIQKKNQNRISNNDYLQYTKMNDKEFVNFVSGSPMENKSNKVMSQYLNSDEKITENREKLHEKIQNDYIQDQAIINGIVSDKEGERYVVFTGGGSASGKTTAIESLINEKIIDNNHVLIDSDLIKTYLPEYNFAIAFGNPSAAKINHEESSILSEKIWNNALDGGYSLIFDGTMKNYGKYQKLVKDAKEKGYNILFVGVEVDLNTAYNRANSRAKRTGRVVPKEIIEESHKSFKNTYESLIKTHKQDSDYITILNNTDPTIKKTSNKDQKKYIGKKLTIVSRDNDTKVVRLKNVRSSKISQIKNSITI